MIEEQDAEKRKEKEKELEAAQKKASLETERRKKAQSSPVRVDGEGWVWVTGKKMRHMTAIALTKARFDRGHQTTFDTWNKIVKELNELIVCAERADGGKPLFRVKGITCNPRISRFERRLEIAEARGDITDEEVTAFLHTQLTAILKEDFERCWIEGKGVTRLVATGVPVSEELAGEKLAEAMEKENREIKWAVRAPERLGGAWGKAQKATIVSFEVHNYDDAAKLIKEGIMIGGKRRHVELFRDTPPRSPQAQHQAQLNKSPVTIGQMKECIYGPDRHQGSRCMGCPTYRTGGKAHDVGKCPLRNGSDNNNNNTSIN